MMQGFPALSMKPWRALLLTAGLLAAALLAAGATRRAPRAAWVPRLAADGLRWRF